MNNRVRKLREMMLGMPEICIERGYLWTESYKETEGQPSIIRRAKALARVLNDMSIGINEGELIVGKTTSKNRGAMLIPEVQWKWYLDEIDLFSTRPWDRCAPLSDDDKEKMRQFLPYWEGKSLYDRWVNILPEEAKKVQFNNLYASNTMSASGVHLAHPTVDFEKVITKGIRGILSEVDEELQKIDMTDMEQFNKYLFLQAVKICHEAVIAFAHRYSRLARELAAKEKNTERKRELEQISEICQRVPENPARSFWEALQSFWFVYIALRIEGLGPGLGVGRADQYFYPFYKKDIDSGKISREKALELLELLLIKINDTAILMSSVMAEQLAGFPTLANIVLGGITLDGKDAVNELSYLFLDAEKEVGLTVEEIVIRVNKNNPDLFLIKACEVNKALTGKFKFLSDNTAIQQMMLDGKPNARDYVVVGCYTPTVPVYSFSTSCCMVNIAFMLELALNNGRSRLTGEQLGPQVGDPRKFSSYEEVWEAFKKTVQAIVPLGMIATNTDRMILATYSQYPFQSSLFHGLIQKGIDVTQGGMAPAATQSHGLIGAPNVGDSLAAIKKVVFEDKKITMERLINALDKNFEGEEEVLSLLNSAPKFGNGDPYVDSIVNDVITLFSDEVAKYKGIRGSKHVTAAAAGTGHLIMGKVVGALPDGRRAGEPLSEGGISPHQGRNTKGLTATLRSVASLDHLKLTGGSVLNIKLNPGELKDEVKMRKFISLLRTYCETGGYLVQFNIVSSATLKDAQAHPEKYRDLLVRVATYSAYFVELSPTLQNDIIARTEFQEI